MQIKNILLATILPLSITLAACSNSGDTAEKSASIKERENIMKNWKDSMEIMGGMVKAPDTFDTAKFKEQAEFLASHADSPWQYFDDANQKNHSTEAVWSDAEGFQAEINKFQAATTELSALAQSATTADEVKPAFGAVGASCKSCHQGFKAQE